MLAAATSVDKVAVSAADRRFKSAKNGPPASVVPGSLMFTVQYRHRIIEGHRTVVFRLRLAIENEHIQKERGKEKERRRQNHQYDCCTEEEIINKPEYIYNIIQNNELENMFASHKDPQFMTETNY